MKRTVVGILAIAALAQGAALKTVCSSGCDYTTPQAAINAAEFGGIIELKAGETFSGEMQLKKKAGTPAYITIRSSRSGELPGGVRVTPADTAKMAKVQNNANVITVEAGASYYRLEGLEVAPTSGSFVYFPLALWPQSPSGGIGIHDPSDRAHHLIIDRCYLHGLPAEDGPQIGVYLEAGYTEMDCSGTDLAYEMGWIGNISGFLGSGFVDFEKAQGGLNNALDVQWDQPSRLLSKSVVVDVQNRRPWPDYPKTNLLTASDRPQSGTIPCPSCAVGDGDGGPWYWENGGIHDVGFVDYAGGNFRLGSSSPYKGWAHEGTDPGADIDTVEWSTAHAADGANNPYLDFRVRAVTPGRTSAGLRFTAYDLNSCRVMVSDRPDFATTVFDHTDEGGNRDRASEVGGLSANTRYFYRVLCSGSRRRDGILLTAP